MKTFRSFFAVCAVAVLVCGLALPALAADVMPPVKPADTAEYQILATTMGGVQGMQAPFTMQLDARGKPAPAGVQQAFHEIPAGMKMRSPLPLIRPDRSAGTPGDYPEGTQDSWTVKIYWGCSKTVPQGQPLVISPQDMKSGKGKAAQLADGGRGVWKDAPPAGWGWGQWPNRLTTESVPAGASLKGEHFVYGNYLPHIKFTIAQHDFLPPLKVKTGDGNLAASIPLTWESVRGSVGYFAWAMAANEAKKETIIWTSSSRPIMGMGMHEHSSRVKELVKSGIVLDPDKTACNIPAGIFEGLQGTVVMLHAWGDDYWASYPAKPANAPKNWKPDWTVNALFLSTWTGMPGVDMEEMMRGVPQNMEQQETQDEDVPRESKSGKAKKNSEGGGFRIPLPPLRF